ncbi:SRPBCC family protein [Nocardia violaceofusca]|uniref:SRPBCC family protein n=1 Tax=Nocardia violaceofusca TaxID=941182 RepID=UPI0007A41B8D|nr:SRPBCC family protein [Nocardia violaceofusca]
MKLDNTFTIPVPAAQAWPVLLDLERIAPCVPGATITSREGDDFHGKIKVKLGPVGLSYNGIIKVISQDEQAGVAVLEGRGREARGNGTATATITCRLVENNGSTDVFVDTDLAITGKPAQFGRGALADVAGTLIGQFATNLADEITASAQPAEPLRAVTEEPAAGAPTVTAQRQRTTASRTPAEPLDLLAAAGSAPVVRYSGFAAALMLVVLVAVIRRRARRG